MTDSTLRRTQDDPLEAHPGRSAGSEDTRVAVEHQRHGNSRTEAALFNVNIDFFFKGNDSRFKSLSLTCVLSRSLIGSLSFSYTYFCENVNILEGPCLRY